jgi:hypothetical protein
MSQDITPPILSVSIYRRGLSSLPDCSIVQELNIQVIRSYSCFGTRDELSGGESTMGCELVQERSLERKGNLTRKRATLLSQGSYIDRELTSKCQIQAE